MTFLRDARPRGAIAAFFLAACATAAVARPGIPAGPLTRAERSAYAETSRYADVVAFLDSLEGRPELSFGSIGRTVEGRDIPYVVASRPRVATPADARALRRPIVYVQGNIHAGEVEGKEALLAVLRDLTSSPRPNALDSVILIAVPIYNADGNERFGPQETNRGSQNGPAVVGVRANAQGLDLNRDYIKAEAPETRGSLAMFTAWNPDVFVDLHTTNGSFHGYALTFAPPLNPASPFELFTREFLLQELKQRMQTRHGFPTFEYGDFISDDTLSKGWVTFDSRPRFGTNYYGVRGGVSILSEAYSHDPFERRVKSTYAFVQEILSVAGLRRLRTRPSLPRSSEPMELSSPDGMIRLHINGQRVVSIRSRITSSPRSGEVVAEIIERTADSVRTESGVPKGRRRTGRFRTVAMPLYTSFEPRLIAPVPEKYLLSSTDTAAVRLLRRHGIEVKAAGAHSSGIAGRVAGYAFRIDSAIVSQRPFQGHREMRLEGRWIGETRSITEGSFIVETAQPLGTLAVYLLEPQSDDGLVTWNYFDSQLRAGGTYPVFKIGGSPPQ